MIPIRSATRQTWSSPTGTDTYPGRVSQLVRHRADDKAWLIVDDETYENTALGPHSKGLERTRPVAVAELEQVLGLPEGALESAIALYNRHTENGVDPVLHKDPRFVTPGGATGRRGGCPTCPPGHREEVWRVPHRKITVLLEHQGVLVPIDGISGWSSPISPARVPATQGWQIRADATNDDFTPRRVR